MQYNIKINIRKNESNWKLNLSLPQDMTGIEVEDTKDSYILKGNASVLSKVKVNVPSDPTLGLNKAFSKFQVRFRAQHTIPVTGTSRMSLLEGAEGEEWYLETPTNSYSICIFLSSDDKKATLTCNNGDAFNNINNWVTYELYYDEEGQPIMQVNFEDDPETGSFNTGLMNPLDDILTKDNLQLLFNNLFEIGSTDDIPLEVDFSRSGLVAPDGSWFLRYAEPKE